MGPDLPNYSQFGQGHFSGAPGVSYRYPPYSSERRRSSKKRRRRSRSSYSYSSSSASRRSHSRRRHKKSKKHKKHRDGKRKRSPSYPSSSSSSSSPERVRIHKTKEVSHRDRSLDRETVPSPHQSRRGDSDDDVVSIHVRNNDFDDKSSHRTLSIAPSNQTNTADSEDQLSFAQTIEEIFKLLPSAEYPRDSAPSVSLPQSAIEDLLKTESKPSCSLPQAKVIKDTWKFLMAESKNSFQKPDWLIDSRVLAKMVPMKSYRCHNESVPSAKAPELDSDHYLLKFSPSGSATLPLKNLTSMEDQARQMIRVLSYADTFSVAAFKCLEQEELNPTVLKRILQSLAISVRHAVGFSSVLAAELFNARRDATIASGKSLCDEAKAILKRVPLNSDTLFGGSLEEVRQKDAHFKKENLVDSASYNGKKQFVPPKSSQQEKKFQGKQNPPKRNQPPLKKPRQDNSKSFNPPSSKPSSGKDNTKYPFSRKGAGGRRH